MRIAAMTERSLDRLAAAVAFAALLEIVSGPPQG